MDCPEIRKRLSSHADGELKDPERHQVSEHLEGCEACRRQYSDQGALDMLLKKHFAPVPPEGYFDTFWPSVDQRVDGEDAAGSNGESDEVVFKSSPALKMLNIPERKAPEPVPVAAAEQAATPQAPPAPQPTSYRWPVAFVLAAAVITGGFLVHKKMNPPGPSSPAAVDPHGTIAGAATAQPPATETAAAAESADAAVGAAGDGTLVATATGIDASTDPASATESHKLARRPKRSRKSKKAAEEKKGETPTEKPAAAEKAPATPKKRAKGGSDLDSLIDNAIGPRPTAPAKAAAKPAPAADDGLPDQLTMNQIRAGMRKISGRVQGCYDKFQIEGKATVKLTISKAGAVTATAIKGKFFGTDTGGCVEKAVKNASFPKFRGKEMTITYPFILQ